MNALLQVTLVNAACATILALGVALAGRYVKRPAVLHTLWTLVLLQFLMPPVFEVGLLPRPASFEDVAPVERSAVVAASASGQSLASEARTTVGVIPVPPASDSAVPSVPLPRPVDVATAIWITGTLWVLGLVLVRTGRFRRLLRSTASGDDVLEYRLARLADRMGVRKPGLRLVRASISPLIRPRFGGAELLFPAGLLSRLDTGEQEAILAHELAHVARRDHWVRFLELIAVSLFWWHPAVWWARSRLRLAEERCCDQLVLETLPGGRSSYARGLLKTVEFLAGTKAGFPALASGVGEVRDLKERLTMILKDRPPKSMSRIQRALLALCTASVLLVFPTWSDRDLQAAPADDTTNENQEEIAFAEAEREYVNQHLQLEQQAAELQHALREIRERQRELEHVWRSETRTAEIEQLESDTDRVRAEDAYARARELYERERALSRSAEREARERDLERDRSHGPTDVERSLRSALLEMERAGAVLDRLYVEALRQREAGHTENADRIEAEIESLREQLLEDRILREKEIQRLLEELERSGGGGIVR